jgi:hypothetical protein
VALTLAGCAKKQAEHRSTSLPSAKERVAWVCEYALCPTKPLDAAFHISPGEDGTVVHAVVKVVPTDVPRWSMGCDNVQVEARPKWLSEVLPRDWAVKTIPDTWRCGGEKRVIHVKEGVIVRSLLSHIAE